MEEDSKYSEEENLFRCRESEIIRTDICLEETQAIQRNENQRHKPKGLCLEEIQAKKSIG